MQTLVDCYDELNESIENLSNEANKTNEIKLKKNLLIFFLSPIIVVVDFDLQRNVLFCVCEYLIRGRESIEQLETMMTLQTNHVFV